MGYKVALERSKANWAFAFYLNHMGYKGGYIVQYGKDVGRFYLNHMGYKVIRIKTGSGCGCPFYLNHMGYKVLVMRVQL